MKCSALGCRHPATLGDGLCTIHRWQRAKVSAAQRLAVLGGLALLMALGVVLLLWSCR
jgi:hypothetical protein